MSVGSRDFRVDWRDGLIVAFYLFLIGSVVLMQEVHLAPLSDSIQLLSNAVAATLLLVLLKRGKNLLALLFLIYAYLVFVFSYSLVDSSLLLEGGVLFLVVTVGFMFGRAIYNLHLPIKWRVKGIDAAKDRLIRRATFCLFVGIALKIFYVGYLITSVGFLQFYSGAYMVSRIGMYANNSTEQLLPTVLQFASTILCVVGIAAYSLNAQKRSSIVLCVLLGFPLLTLDRGAFFSGGIAVAYIYRNKLRIRHLIALGSLVLTVAVTFANIRSLELGTEETALPLQAIVGELSVSRDIHLISETIKKQGVSYGGSILGPLVTMPIPRALYPNKPLLTSAIIMQEYFPDEARAGFYLAPTVFGDWLYNFGYAGVFFISLIAGRIITRADRMTTSYFGVVLSYYLYSLLRDNFAQGATFVLICTVIGWFIGLSYRLRLGPNFTCREEMGIRHYGSTVAGLQGIGTSE